MGNHPIPRLREAPPQPAPPPSGTPRMVTIRNTVGGMNGLPPVHGSLGGLGMALVMGVSPAAKSNGQNGGLSG